jgi:transposase
MEPIYIGVDFHSRQQTICYLTTETGELVITELKHQDKERVHSFYQQFPGHVIVGLEASGYSPWFEALLEELGCEVWLGDATEIRRRARWRYKDDRRDAELIWDLMVHQEFPRLHQPLPQSREILRMLRYRHKLVKMRTIIKNSLQALSIQSGLSLRARLFTRAGLEQLRAVPMSPVMQYQREQWLAALAPLNQRIVEAVNWLEEQAAGDERIERLRTHPGIGLLTGLGLVHTLAQSAALVINARSRLMLASIPRNVHREKRNTT